MRSFLRLLFGRIGRAVGVLLVVAAAWFYWWVWPVRPLRSICINWNMDYTPQCTPTRDGKAMLLSQSLLSSLMPLRGGQRFVSLIDGRDLIDPQLLDGEYHAKPILNKPWILLQGQSDIDEAHVDRVYDYIERLWINPPRNELVTVPELDIFFDGQIVASADNQWQRVTLGEPRFSENNNWLIELFDFLHWPDYWYGVMHTQNRWISLRIPANHCWAGFAPNNRAWTTVSPENEEQITLHEWDISFKRPPWWLYALTAASVLFIAIDFLCARRVRASSKRR